MKYRGPLLGAMFGLSISLVDVAMHSQMDGRPFLDELLSPSPGMLLYRSLFLAVGLATGMLIAQRSRHEQQTAELKDSICKLRQDIAGPAAVIHHTVQRLLMSQEDEAKNAALLRSIHEQSQKLQAALRR